MAAIDRLVHHSVILEFAVRSLRSEKAAQPASDDNYPTPPPRRGRRASK